MFEKKLIQQNGSEGCSASSWAVGGVSALVVALLVDVQWSCVVVGVYLSLMLTVVDIFS